MARKIIWTKRAQDDRKLIYSYWNKRNKSKLYSSKLNGLFISASEFVAINPHTGRLTDRLDVRIKFITHFALIYEFSDTQLIVLSIFDTRQGPESLKRIIEA